jgi:hypothetical protein
MPSTATPETALLIAQLIQGEMELADGIVTIYNQKRRLPPAKAGFNIDVAIVGDRPFAVNSRFADPGSTEDLDETVTINMQEVVQVDIFSYDDSARLNRIGIIFALASIAAQQLSEQYGFQIGRIPPNFVDVSEVEASKRLNRYALTFNVLRAYERTKSAATFAEFSQPQLYYNP